MRLSFGILILISLVVSAPATAQLGPYDWGGVLDESCWDSGAGEIAELPGVGYVFAGMFSYVALTLGDDTFTPAPSTWNTFVTCMDGADSHVWSRHFIGVSILDIATSPDGNTVLTGGLLDEYDLGDGMVTGSDDEFLLLSLDPTGQTNWSAALGGPGVGVRAIAVNDAGEIFVAGTVTAAVDLGGGVLPFGGDNDAFIAKYDQDGTHLWSQTFGDAEFQSLFDLDLDPNGNVIVTGWGTGTIDTGLGPVATSSNLRDCAILAAFDSGGVPRFARWIEASTAIGYAVACGPAGEIFVAGQYRNRIYFEDGTLFPVDHDDIFVAKYTSSGAYVWGRSYGTETNEEKGQCARSDGNGGVIVTGMFRGSTNPIDFGGGPVSAGTTHDSAFILFLDGDGSHRASYGESYGPSKRNSLVRGGDGSIAWVGTEETREPSFHAFIATYDPPVSTAAPDFVRAPGVVLQSARPNPFNPRTHVQLVVDAGKSEVVSLRVFDSAGRLVKVLFDGVAGPGDHDVEWDGTDLSGRQVASGTYHCRLDCASGVQTTKLSLVR